MTLTLKKGSSVYWALLLVQVLCLCGSTRAWGTYTECPYSTCSIWEVNLSTQASTVDDLVYTEVMSSEYQFKAACKGYNYFLYLDVRGTVYATGSAISRGIGVDAAANTIPEPVEGITGPVSKIYCGRSHSIAITEDGKVFTAGEGSYGELGRTYRSDSEVFGEVTGVSNVVSGSAGWFTSYAVTATGDAYAWGRNDGRLGLGTTTFFVTTPQQVPLSNVQMVDGGRDFVVYSVAGGNTYAAGYQNSEGRLGIGDTTTPTTPTLQTTRSPFAAPVLFSAAYSSFQMVQADGHIFGSGSNTHGILGNGATSSGETSLVQAVNGLTPYTGITSIGTGTGSTLYAMNGDLYFTGLAGGHQGHVLTQLNNIPGYVYSVFVYETKGYLIIGPPPVDDPTPSTTPSTLLSPSSTPTSTITSTRTPVAPSNSPTPTVPADIRSFAPVMQRLCRSYTTGCDGYLGETLLDSNILDVCTGQQDWYAYITAAGELYVSATDNSFGQVGMGSTDATSGIEQNTFLTTPGVALACGGTHMLVLDREGAVWSAGELPFAGGELEGYKATLTKLPYFEEVIVDIKASTLGSQALGASGRVYAWGDNNMNALGVGMETYWKESYGVPGIVELDKEIVSMAIGFQTSYFVGSDGHLHAVGKNQKAQLGRGNTVTSIDILDVNVGSSFVVGVAAGDKSCLFWTTTGELYSIGSNDDYQTGHTGSTAYKTSATLVPGFGTSVGRTVIGAYISTSDYSNGIKSYSGVWTAEGELFTFGGDVPSGPAFYSTGSAFDIAITAGYSRYTYLGGASPPTPSPSPTPNVPSATASPTVSPGGMYASIGEPQYAEYNWIYGSTYFAPLLPVVSVGHEAFNTEYFLGADASVYRIADPLVPVLTSIARLFVADNGADNTFALDLDGGVWATGYNYQNSLGLGYEDGPQSTWVRLATFDAYTCTISKISLSLGTTLFLCDNGDVYGTGDNRQRQLGIAGTDNVIAPTPIEVPGTVADIAAGASHSIILLDDGRMYGIGDNSLYQLSTGDNVGRSSWTQMTLHTSNTVPTKVFAGPYKTAYIDVNNDAFYIGPNEYQQCGCGSSDQSIQVFTEMVGKSDLAGFSFSWTTISFMPGYSYAISDEGFLFRGGNHNTGSQYTEMVPLQMAPGYVRYVQTDAALFGPEIPSASPSGTPSAPPTPSNSVSPTSTGSVSPTSSVTSSDTSTASRTPSASATASSSVTVTPSSSPSSSVSATSSSSATITATATSSATATSTRTPSSSASASNTAAPSGSPTSASTPTSSPTGSVSASVSATVSSTQTTSKTVTSSKTMTPTATATASPSMSSSGTASSSMTSTGTGTATTSVTPSHTTSATTTESSGASASSTPAPSESSSVTPSISVSVSLSKSLSASQSVSHSASSSKSSTASETATPTGTSTGTSSVTPSASSSESPSKSHSATSAISASASVTAAASDTATPTSSRSASTTRSPTATGSVSPSSSVTSSKSASGTPTSSVSTTPTSTPTSSGTPAQSSSATASASSSATHSVSRSASASESMPPSSTPSTGSSHSATPSNSQSSTVTSTKSSSASKSVSSSTSSGPTPSSSSTETASSSTEPSPSSSVTLSKSPTSDPSASATASVSASETSAPSASLSSGASASSTSSVSLSASVTPSKTTTASATSTVSASSTVTSSRSASASSSSSESRTSSPSREASPSSASSVSPTPTRTASQSESAVPTSSVTPPASASRTSSPTPSPVVPLVLQTQLDSVHPAVAGGMGQFTVTLENLSGAEKSADVALESSIGTVSYVSTLLVTGLAGGQTVEQAVQCASDTCTISFTDEATVQILFSIEIGSEVTDDTVSMQVSFGEASSGTNTAVETFELAVTRSTTWTTDLGDAIVMSSSDCLATAVHEIIITTNGPSTLRASDVVDPVMIANVANIDESEPEVFISAVASSNESLVICGIDADTYGFACSMIGANIPPDTVITITVTALQSGYITSSTTLGGSVLSSVDVNELGVVVNGENGEISIEQDLTLPVPSSVTCSAVSSTAIDVAWLLSPNVVCGSIPVFRVDVGVVGAGDSLSVAASQVTDNPYTLTGLLPGTTYELAVRSRRNTDASEYSERVSCTTDDSSAEVDLYVQSFGDITVTSGSDAATHVITVGNSGSVEVGEFEVTFSSPRGVNVSVAATAMPHAMVCDAPYAAWDIEYSPSTFQFAYSYTGDVTCTVSGVDALSITVTASASMYASENTDSIVVTVTSDTTPPDANTDNNEVHIPISVLIDAEIELMGQSTDVTNNLVVPGEQYSVTFEFTNAGTSVIHPDITETGVRLEATLAEHLTLSRAVVSPSSLIACTAFSAADGLDCSVSNTVNPFLVPWLPGESVEIEFEFTLADSETFDGSESLQISVFIDETLPVPARRLLSLGSEAPVAEFSFALGLPPARPEQVSCVSATHDQIEVSYSFTSGRGEAVIGYEVAHDAGSGVFTTVHDVVCSDAAPLPCTVTGLVPRTAYHFSVRAENSHGYGKWAPLTFCTTAESAPTSGPELTRAAFGEFGNTITLEFSLPTDAGSSCRESFPGTDPCSLMLSSNVVAELGSGASCKFISSTEMRLVLGNGAAVSPGDIVELQTDCVKDSEGQTFATGSAVASSPENGVRPSVVVDAPQNVPFSLGTVTLDVSQSDSNGRDPESIVWEVLAPTSQSDPIFYSDDLYNFFATQNDDNVSLEMDMVPPGATIRVSVTIANFLGFTDASEFGVSRLAFDAPETQLLVEDIELKRSEGDFLIGTHVDRQETSGGVSMFYRWSVGSSLFSAQTVSTSVMEERLATANQGQGQTQFLFPVSEYTPVSAVEMIFTACYAPPGCNRDDWPSLAPECQCNEARETVSVGTEDVTLDFIGGSTKFVSVGATFELAVDINDPNCASSTNCGNTVAWSCDVLESSSDTASVLRSCTSSEMRGLSPNAVSSTVTADEEGFFRYHVSYENTEFSISAEGDVFVEVTGTPEVPDVSLSLLNGAHASSIDTTDYVGVSAVASVAGVVQNNFVYTWSVRCDADPNVQDRLADNLVSGAVSGASPSAVFIPGFFLPDARYFIDVEARDAGSATSGRASIMVHTNSPPASGVCRATPSTVNAFEDVTIRCTQWVDANKPLKYAFDRVKTNGEVATLSAAGSKSTLTTSFANIGTNSVTINVRVTITDTLGMSTKVTVPVVVLPASTGASTREEFVESLVTTGLGDLTNSRSDGNTDKEEAQIRDLLDTVSNAEDKGVSVSLSPSQWDLVRESLLGIVGSSELRQSSNLDASLIRSFVSVSSNTPEEVSNLFDTALAILARRKDSDSALTLSKDLFDTVSILGATSGTRASDSLKDIGAAAGEGLFPGQQEEMESDFAEMHVSKSQRNVQSAQTLTMSTSAAAVSSSARTSSADTVATVWVSTDVDSLTDSSFTLVSSKLGGAPFGNTSSLLTQIVSVTFFDDEGVEMNSRMRTLTNPMRLLFAASGMDDIPAGEELVCAHWDTRSSQWSSGHCSAEASADFSSVQCFCSRFTSEYYAIVSMAPSSDSWYDWFTSTRLYIIAAAAGGLVAISVATVIGIRMRRSRRNTQLPTHVEDGKPNRGRNDDGFVQYESRYQPRLPGYNAPRPPSADASSGFYGDGVSRNPMYGIQNL